MHLFRKALPTLKSNHDGGVFLITSSIAGISPGGSSMAYSVSKAAGQPSHATREQVVCTDEILAGLQLMKCLAATQGPEIRVNAVLPGLLLTEWV